MTDTADLEQMVNRLAATGDYRVLRRLHAVERYSDDGPDANKRLGVIVDVETTGLDPTADKIIELAILPFHFSSDGMIYDVLPGYAGFEDPGQPLSDEVIQITGITDDQLREQRLDDDAVNAIAEPACLVIGQSCRSCLPMPGATPFGSGHWKRRSTARTS